MIDVERPARAPASLARATECNGEDVLEALHTTFLGGCNQRRGRYPAGELLHPGQGIETRVVQKIEGTVSFASRAESARPVFRAVDDADEAAQNTAVELDRIHNATLSSRPHAARALRMRIFEHIVVILPRIYEYARLEALPAPDHTHLASRRRWVQERVSRRAPYSMLVRGYFGHIEAVRALFD